MADSTPPPHVILYNPRTAKPGYQRLPLSLLRIASTLGDLCRYDIIDANLDQDTDPVTRIQTICRERNTRFLGITIMPGPQLQNAVPELKRIRAAIPDLQVVAGGYFPGIHWETCVRSPLIDYVIVGEGDAAFPELIRCLETGSEPWEIPGIAGLRDGVPFTTGPAPAGDPDRLPPIPYDDVDVARYITATHLGQRTLSHHSSVGCPFTCNFCAVPVLSRGCWQGESAGRLLDVTENMVNRYRIDALEFHDNNFFVSEKRVRDFCAGLLDRGIHIRWWGEGRVDTLLKFSDTTWELMRDSGLAMVFMGAESGDPAKLKMMNKGGTLTGDSILELAGKAKRYGIVPELSFICGNPPDPADDIRRTIRFIRRLKQINPATEIILYRYDPVPYAGAMWNAAETSGFAMPETLEDWISEHWAKVHQRRKAELPWLSASDQQALKDFETVLNAYYPTTTSRRIQRGLPRLLLFLASAWRYHLRVYCHPVELRFLQKKIRYQRPETSGF